MALTTNPKIFWLEFSLLTRPTASYLITRSAFPKTLGGIVNPIWSAALRLITDSNFVGCSTGKSAGLVTLLVSHSCRLPHGCCLFDDSICFRQHFVGDGEADLLGSFEIDDKLEFGGLLHRQIGGLCTFQDSIDIACRTSKQIVVVRAVVHEAPFFNVFRPGVSGWEPVLHGELYDRF